MSDTVSTGKNCIKMNVNLFIFFFIPKTHAITQMFIIHFCLHYIIPKGLILSLYKNVGASSNDWVSGKLIISCCYTYTRKYINLKNGENEINSQIRIIKKIWAFWWWYVSECPLQATKHLHIRVLLPLQLLFRG